MSEVKSKELENGKHGRGVSELTRLLCKQGDGLRVLNLYAGLGGNRKLWKNADVTAVEIDEDVASVYQSFFPADNVIVGDAHAYLLEHYEQYDFIWTSPPCPTHSRINFSRCRDLEYPDMKLWQEIIFLKTWYEGKFCVENVIPYYEPLIPGKQIDKHVFWTNFRMGNFEPSRSRKIRSDQIPELQELTGFDLSDIALKDKRKRLRNCVHPEIGKHVFDRVTEILTKNKADQGALFA